MSAGHRHKHDLSKSELDDLLAEALADKRVQVALAEPYRLDTRHDIPLLGSSSINRRTVLFDQHLRHGNWPYGVLPVDGRRLDVKPGLRRHERLEPILENIFGWPYLLAHDVATEYEHRDYRAKGFDPAAVEKAYAPFIRTDERESLRDVPTDLDLRPMLHDAKLLERTRASQDRNKVAQERVGYVGKSPHQAKKCGLCSMFVQPMYGGPACTLVKNQIAEEGYCRRFARGALGQT